MKIDTLTKVEWFIRVRTFYGKVMNLDVFILATYILLDQPHLNAIAKKTKGKQYDMGCECGKRKVDAHAEQDCELSAKLEESGPIDHDKYHRIVGGCNAGHTPWYTLFILTESNVKCGGALINKFWILSAAHCFCNEEYMNCNKVKNKWVPDYDITKIKVGASIVVVKCQCRIQIFIGADNQSVQQNDQVSKGSSLQWTNSFYPAEIIIHYKYYMKEIRNKTTYARKGQPLIYPW